MRLPRYLDELQSQIPFNSYIQSVFDEYKMNFLTFWRLRFSRVNELVNRVLMYLSPSSDWSTSWLSTRTLLCKSVMMTISRISPFSASWDQEYYEILMQIFRSHSFIRDEVHESEVNVWVNEVRDEMTISSWRFEANDTSSRVTSSYWSANIDIILLKKRLKIYFFWKILF